MRAISQFRAKSVLAFQRGQSTAANTIIDTKWSTSAVGSLTDYSLTIGKSTGTLNPTRVSNLSLANTEESIAAAMHQGGVFDKSPEKLAMMKKLHEIFDQFQLRTESGALKAALYLVALHKATTQTNPEVTIQEMLLEFIRHPQNSQFAVRLTDKRSQFSEAKIVIFAEIVSQQEYSALKKVADFLFKNPSASEKAYQVLMVTFPNQFTVKGNFSSLNNNSELNSVYSYSPTGALEAQPIICAQYKTSIDLTKFQQDTQRFPIIITMEEAAQRKFVPSKNPLSRQEHINCLLKVVEKMHELGYAMLSWKPPYCIVGTRQEEDSSSNGGNCRVLTFQLDPTAIILGASNEMIAASKASLESLLQEKLIPSPGGQNQFDLSPLGN